MLAKDLDALESRLMRNGYNVKVLTEYFASQSAILASIGGPFGNDSMCIQKCILSLLGALAAVILIPFGIISLFAVPLPLGHAKTPAFGSYTPKYAVPAGFGGEDNAFTSAKDLSLQNTCTRTDLCTPVGNIHTTSSKSAVYEKGYHGPGSTWQEYTFSPEAGTLGGIYVLGDIKAGDIKATEPLSYAGTYTQRVAPICTLTDNFWVCGCRSRSCITPYWQLQVASERVSGGGSGGTSWVDRHGMLQVEGNKIVGQHGHPVFLMGMSLYWSIWGQQKYWTKEVIDWLVSDWAISVIRAPMAVEINDGPGSQGWVYDRPGQLALMEKVIDAAIANGIYVIVDWHTNYAEQYVNAAVDFFTYGSHPNIIWEIYGEPATGDWEIIRNYALQVTTAIRQHSPNLIISGTPWGSWGVHYPVSNPLPDGNTAYIRHIYVHPSAQDAIDNTTTALNGGLAVFVSEWGETDASGGISDPTLNFVEGLRWINWCKNNGVGGMAKWSISDPSHGGSTAVLNPGVSTTGGWNPDTDLSPSGVWIRNKIREINTD